MFKSQLSWASLVVSTAISRAHNRPSIWLSMSLFLSVYSDNVFVVPSIMSYLFRKVCMAGDTVTPKVWRRLLRAARQVLVV